MPKDRRSSALSVPAAAPPAAEPPDADQRLLDQVRPSDWVAPCPAERYDLVVLGGGADRRPR